MEQVYKRTKGIRDDMVSGFCPGCIHGTVFKLIGEVLEELDILEKTVTVQGAVSYTHLTLPTTSRV